MKDGEGITAYLAGIGLLGPGLPGWTAARRVLAGEIPWETSTPVLPPPALLAANERRRAGQPVRLALAVCDEAVRMSGLSPATLNGVFGSANGEGVILHELLTTLASETPQLSPTKFHNSVHNAVAGYWAMAAQCSTPTTSLSAAGETFAATLMTAFAELAAEHTSVLACAYDVPLPEPLAGRADESCVFGCAFVLTPNVMPGTLGRMRLMSRAGRFAPTAVAVTEGTAFTDLAGRNAAAQSLALLQAIATGRPASVPLGLLETTLLVQFEPCLTAPPSRL
jgi:hypothetical protein